LIINQYSKLPSKCIAFWLLAAVIMNANTIRMATEQVCRCAGNSGVEVIQWAAETSGI
jgi:hypothetical protein